MILNHPFYSLERSFKKLNEVDSSDFGSGNDILLLHGEADFKLHILVHSMNLPILVEPVKFQEWLKCTHDLSLLYEDNRRTVIETPVGKSERLSRNKERQNEIKTTLNNIQKKGFVSAPPPSCDKNSFALELSRIDKKSGYLIVNYDSLEYFLVFDKFYNCREAMIVYTKDNSTIGFLKSDLEKLLSRYKQEPESIKNRKQKKKNSKLVEYNGKWIKPESKEKYIKWQNAVNKKHSEKPLLSHSAICTRIASDLGTTQGNLVRVTKLHLKK